MYNDMTFAPVKLAKRAQDITEAQQIILDNQLTVKPVKMLLGELKINEDGSITNGQTRQITQFGFESLCRVLGIPHPFARKIPKDLLFTNIRRLQNDNNGEAISLLERPDGSIANIVRGTYAENSYADVLGFMDGKDIKYIDIGERLLSVAMVFQELNLTYAANDLFYTGTFVTSSLTRDSSLMMESGLYRTLCSNSFVMPLMGRLRADYRLAPEDRLLRFTEQLRCYDDLVVGQVKRGLPQLGNRLMYRREVVSVWRQLNSKLGELGANQAFKIDSATREALFAAEKADVAENKKARLHGKPVDPPAISNLLFYDVLNAITSQSQQEHEQSKVMLERYAGKLLKNLVIG